MYTSLSIKNFRAFETLEIEGLKRVNLFTGRNNSGKTSVLEAVYLLEGEHVTLRARRLFETRGLAAVSFTRFSARTMPWATLFRSLGVEKDIHISGLQDTAQPLDVILTTTLDEEARNNYVNGFRMPHIDVESRAILIARKSHLAQSRDAIWVTNGKIQPDVNDESTLRPSSYLISGTKPSHTELSRYLDGLELVKGTDPILQALLLIDPRLQGLKTNTSAGPSLLYADLGGATLLPLAVVGDGMLRMLEIVFAILQNPGRAVMIDEIENGFHYSVLPKVWELIHKLAKQYNVQVFAVTHSHECAVAAHVAAEADNYGYFRIEQKNGIGRAVAYSHEQMQTSIEANLEVR